MYNYCHMLFNDTYYTYSIFILHLQLLYSNVNNPIAFYLKWIEQMNILICLQRNVKLK